MQNQADKIRLACSNFILLKNNQHQEFFPGIILFLFTFLYTFVLIEFAANYKRRGLLNTVERLYRFTSLADIMF